MANWFLGEDDNTYETQEEVNNAMASHKEENWKEYPEQKIEGDRIAKILGDDVTYFAYQPEYDHIKGTYMFNSKLCNNTTFHAYDEEDAKQAYTNKLKQFKR